MLLYRMQVSDGNEWSTQWMPTQAEAQEEFKKAVDGMGDTHEIHVDKVVVPTGASNGASGRSCVSACLNRAQLERSSWVGEVVYHHTPDDSGEDDDLEALFG